MRIVTAALLSATALVAARADAISFVSALAIAGDRTDLSGLPAGANGNRLGGFGSDLVRVGETYYGLVDRGAGGGVYDYAPRIQAFKLSAGADGAPTGLTVTDTILLKNAAGQPAFTGKAPANRQTLGTSIDPEGLAVDRAGNFYISDEYAPTVRQFSADGTLLRTFEVPANLVPRRANGSVDYNGDRDNVKLGRQDNRGFEGVTLSNDGTKLYAMLQDPLFEEGPGDQGRRGANVRIVEYDVATGVQSAQYAYTLDSVADVNANLPADQQFTANQQGRKIGISSIQMLPNGKLLVLERDGRGLGTDEDYLTGGLRAIGSKRVYTVDLAGATDIKGLTLTGGVLPAGVRPVTKSGAPWLDILASVGGAATLVEKLEGMSFSDMLSDGGRFFYVLSDNDFSVTQTGGGVQQDICFDASGSTYAQVALGGACPTGTSLIPSYLYTFRLTKDEAASLGFATSPVPEPASWALLLTGFGLVGAAARRRRATAVRA